MAEYCPKCFEPIDFLHKCGSNSANSEMDFGGGLSRRIKIEIGTLIGAAPLAGILLDQFVALPSSLVHSLILSTVGSGLVALIWVMINFRGTKSFKFYVQNIPNFLYTPNIFKIFGTSDNRKLTSTWLLAVVASTFLQIILFTPGNANYLASSVANQIDSASGANLEVKCPGYRLYFYNEPIECQVKTGILWIKVPARAELSPFFGTSTIKVSLL